jgi:hypothetical protein
MLMFWLALTGVTAAQNQSYVNGASQFGVVPMNPYFGYRIQVGFYVMNITTVFTVDKFLHAPEGANSISVMARNPYYPNSQATNQCDVTVQINNPQNGSNFFYIITGSPYVNLTVDIIGGSPTDCQYQFIGYDWNSMDVCSSGVNGSWVNIVSLPEGYPDTINVSAVVCGQVISNTASFTVYGRTGATPDDLGEYMVLIVTILCALLVVVLTEKRVKHGKR